MRVKLRDDGLPANPVFRWLALDARKGEQRAIEARLSRRGEPDGSPPFDDPTMHSLGERFDFTVKDLEANRRGDLSDRQIERYRSWSATTLPNAAKIGAAAGGLLGIFLWLSSGDPALLMVGLVIFAMALAIGLYLRWFLHLRHARAGKVKSVTGRISHHPGPEDTELTSVHDGESSLRGRNWVRERGDLTVFANVPYATVYYLQGYATTTVHSIEPAEPLFDS